MHRIKCFLAILLFVVLLTACAGDKTEDAFSEKKQLNETIQIVAFGDNLLHMPVVNSGKQADGSYEYSHLFQKLQPMIKDADIAVIGQETVFGGADLGYSGYPMFNSPSDMGKSLMNEGFDVILHASNHVLDKMVHGVEKTLEFWDNYPDATILGINKSEEEKQRVVIKEVKGAKLALLNYTYGTNGIVLPNEKQYLVNYIDEEKIEKDVTYAEENADFTIAFMHWGTEYSQSPDDAQKRLSELMCRWGVDLIIGSHPHVIEPVEWYRYQNGNEMLVYYSLGNFVSRQLEARNLLGGIADVELKFNGERVYIHDYSFVPIVTHYDMAYKNFAVYRLSEYNDGLAGAHGVAQKDGPVSVKRWRDLVDDTFFGYDTVCVKY
ncbi:MAG: CapA family protein [Clostridia bacterium]|nr:CapA family protein [Clostridia bacterium]